MKRGHKIIAAFAVILATAILIPCLYHWHLKAVNEAYFAQLIAQGEPLTMEQVLPPVLPAAQNGADTFLHAAALLDADNSFLHTNFLNLMTSAGPGKALVCSRLFEARGSYATNTWGELAAAVAQNHTALDLLLETTNRPNFDFGLNYATGMDDSFNFTNLHAGKLRQAEKYLSASAISALHEGDTTSAITSEHALIALVNAAQRERLLISELLRIAVMRGAQASTWEILQHPGVTGTELEILQKDWEQVDIVGGARDAINMERVTGNIAVQKMRRSAASFESMLNLDEKARAALGEPADSESAFDRAKQAIKIFLWQNWWSYPDELRALKGDQAIIDALRLAATEGCFQAAISNQQAALSMLQITHLPDSVEALFGSGELDWHSFQAQATLTLAGATRKALEAECARRMTITAIALQRYKLANGRYPDQLAALTPGLVTSTPRDPVDGRRLRYRLQADGSFLLYSIGENGIDDGGNPKNPTNPSRYSWLDRGALDWVWPQAVTTTNGDGK